VQPGKTFANSLKSKATSNYSSENCTVRRERTNTPLQALVTMNDTQFMEAARHLAETAMLQETTFDSRLDSITLHAIAEGKIPVEPLVTGKVGVEGVAKAFEDLGSPERHAKILVEPWRS